MLGRHHLQCLCHGNSYTPHFMNSMYHEIIYAISAKTCFSDITVTINSPYSRPGVVGGSLLSFPPPTDETKNNGYGCDSSCTYIDIG